MGQKQQEEKRVESFGAKMVANVENNEAWDMEARYQNHLSDERDKDFIGPRKGKDKFKIMSKKEISEYQKMMSDVGFYDGEIDGIAGPKTRGGSVKFQDLIKKGYTKSQMFRHSIGAPHMSDEEWGDYIGGKKRFRKIEDTVIDSMKKGY